MAWVRTFPVIAEGGRVFLDQPPYSFDLSEYEVVGALSTGGCLHAVSREETEDLRALFAGLRASGVEVWTSTPSFADLCLADKGFAQRAAARRAPVPVLRRGPAPFHGRGPARAFPARPHREHLRPHRIHRGRDLRRDRRGGAGRRASAAGGHGASRHRAASSSIPRRARPAPPGRRARSSSWATRWPRAISATPRRRRRRSSRRGFPTARRRAVTARAMRAISTRTACCTATGASIRS